MSTWTTGLWGEVALPEAHTSVAGSLLASGALLAVSGVPFLETHHPVFACMFTCGISPCACLCPNFPLL